MLNYRVCCKASGYRSGGCQCQSKCSRIHASISTFKSHMDTAAANLEVPINAWTQQEAVGCQDGMLCFSLPPRGTSRLLDGLVLESGSGLHGPHCFKHPLIMSG